MKKNFSLAALLVFAATVVAFSQNSTGKKFDASAIFQPGMSTMQAARETCSQASGSQFGECFVRRMQAAGASPQALTFMRAVQDDGYMRDFRNTGRVDIAFAYFPMAANENQHCLLVNGNPSLIDVDDYDLLPKNDLAKNREYSTLAGKFPNIEIFPGNRSGTKFILAKGLSGGGQRFMVPYILVDGCHACARIGSLQLFFDFDREGKFLSVKVAGVRPLPSPTASAP